MMYLKLAILSLRQHFRRTIVIIAAVAVAVIVMLMVDAMLAGMRTSFFTNTLGDSGHLQLHDADWDPRDNSITLQMLIQDAGPITTALANDKRVAVAEELVQFGAYAIGPGDDRQLPVIVHGVETATAFFSSVRVRATGGAGQAAAHNAATARRLAAAEGLALGVPAADLLDAGLGDAIVLLVEDTQGVPFYGEFAVASLFESVGREFDTRNLFLNIDDARELTYMGGAASEIRVRLLDPGDAEQFARDHELLFADRGVVANTWRDIHGSFIVFLDLLDLFVIFMNLLVAIVAATVIANAVLMSYYRRISEFGTLRAIGLKRRGQTGLIFLEGAFQGLAGAVVGVLLALPGALYLQANGINMGAVMETIDLGNTIYFDLTIDGIVRSGTFGLLVTLISAAYTAAVAGKLSIVSMFSNRR